MTWHRAPFVAPLSFFWTSRKNDDGFVVVSHNTTTKGKDFVSKKEKIFGMKSRRGHLIKRRS